jgi:phage shock protein PspC (stress-responsive transcriptional regulator)
MANTCAAAKDCHMSEQSTSDPQTGMNRLFGTLRGIGIRRRTDDTWIRGVCSGLADRLGVDPVIVRAGFVLLALLGGVGITIYLLAWALIPNDRDEIVAQRALRDGDGASIVVIVFAALALFGGSAFGGPWWGGQSGWGFPWGLAFAGLLIWWLVRRSHNPEADQRVRAQQFGTPVPAGASPTAAGQTVPQTQVIPQSSAVPQTQVVPKKLRRRSGGPLMALLAIGLALATYGSLIWAGNTFGWAGNHAAIAFAGSLAAIGLLLVVLGLAGWRAGFVTFLAIVLAVSAWANTVVPSGLVVGGPVGDAVWTPTSVTAGANYHLGVGDGVLDLTGLPTGGLSTAIIPPTITASVGMGDLKVLVPQGLTVKVVGHVNLGEILLPTDTARNGQGGSEVSQTIVVGEGPTQVVVNAEVGIGQLTLVKE